MSRKLFRTIGKIAGVVAVVARFIPGVGPLISAIASVVAIGASALGKPKSPKTPPANIDRLNANIDPRTPRKAVFGYTAMATDIRDQEFSSDQSTLHRFIVVASHKVQSIEAIYFDDKLAWTVGGGAQGEFVGYLTVTPILEGNAGNAINISARMGTSRRYTGMAYVHIQYKLTGNTKKTQSPFAQSVPTRVTIIGKGWPTYDPRLDTTVGGSGAHRANDQTTWTWDDNASNNPAIQLLNHYLGWKIAGKLAVGKGIPAARIDMASFITAANICDESVALSGGGTQPRYRTACVISESDGLELVNDNFKAAMNAELDDAEGKIRLTVLHNDLGSPVADFTDDDVLGNVDWQPFSALDESYNAIRGVYTDPSTNSLYQQVDYPQPTPLTSPDGIERMLQFDLPMVENSARAQRLAKQRLQREQYPGTLSFEGGHRYWKVQKNDIIRQTFTPLGFSLKLFRVAKVGVRVDGVVPIVLREENAAIYAWSAEDSAAVSPAAPTLYDFTKNPQYLDLSDALLATVDLTLTAIGTAPPLIQGNKVTNSTGADTYETMVRGPALAGACFAECDIVSGANYTSIALDGSATDKASNNQDLLAEYLSTSGGLQIFRGASSILSTTIATGLAGKLQAAYDGVRYRVFVAGTEYAASSVTYPGMIAASAPLAHYPKWTPYTLGSTLTGLRAGPFTDNNFGSMGGNGTPDPYATGSDNLIANASLAADASQWAFSGGVTRAAGGATDPVPGYLSFPASAASYAFSNNDSFISLSGLNKLYVSGLSFAASGAGSGFFIVCAWFKADGSASSITTSNSLDIVPVVAATWTPFSTSFVPPADAALCKIYFQRISTTGAVGAGALRVAKTEPAADVTLNAVPVVDLTTQKTIAADYLGALIGSMPVTFSPSVKKNGTSIKFDDATTYAITKLSDGSSGADGGTVSVDNTNGSGTKGDVSISAFATGSVKVAFRLTVSVSGVAIAAVDCALSKVIGAAPGGGSSGGGSKLAQVIANQATSSTTYAKSHSAANPTLVVASGEQLYASATISYELTGGTGTRTGSFKHQYSADNSAWTDFGAAVTGTSAKEGFYDGVGEYVDPILGSVTINQTAAVSAGTYYIRTVFVISATGRTITCQGETITYEAKP